MSAATTEIVVAKNTPVPVERVRNFSTSRDGQTDVHIQIAQGEGKHFADNERLGTLYLRNLPPAAARETLIEVAFLIDSNGILNVRARDTATGQKTEARMEVVGAPDLDPSPLAESSSLPLPLR